VSTLSPERADAALAAYAAGARDGRLSSFVPASGAGTRLFSSLLQVYRSGLRTFADIQDEADRGDADAADAARKYHLTARQAGEIAAAARVAVLVPFHFSPRYGDRLAELRAEAQAAFGGIVA
jgi:phosphoribosyl 1,2-cyclic phosphodiesterase